MSLYGVGDLRPLRLQIFYITVLSKHQISHIKKLFGFHAYVISCDICFSLSSLTKKWYKWTYSQNRNRPTDAENKLRLTKGDRRRDRSGVWGQQTHGCIEGVSSHRAHGLWQPTVGRSEIYVCVCI